MNQPFAIVGITTIVPRLGVYASQKRDWKSRKPHKKAVEILLEDNI
jgi:hypothetical protein